jgi:hypothetical protein
MNALFLSLRTCVQASAEATIGKPGREVFVMACVATGLFVFLPSVVFLITLYADTSAYDLIGLLYVFGISAVGFLLFLLLAVLIVGVGLNSSAIKRTILWGGVSILPPIILGLALYYKYIFSCSCSALTVCCEVSTKLGFFSTTLLLGAVVLAVMGWIQHRSQMGDWN